MKNQNLTKYTQFKSLYPFINRMRRINKNTQLLLSKKQLSDAVLDNMPGIIYVLDENGVFIWWNKNMEKVTGYSAEELSQYNIFDIIAEEDRDYLAGKIREMFSRKQAITELNILTKKGKKIFHDITTIRVVEGYKNYLFGVGIDITSRKRVEKLLQSSEVLYRRLFEAAQDGILILDVQTGKIIDVNNCMTDMLGYSQNEFLGKKLSEVTAFKDIEVSKIALTELQKKRYVHYDNLLLQTTEKKKINVEFVSNVYEVNNKNVIQCNIRNITARKKAEDDLQHSEERFKVQFKSTPVPTYIWKHEGDDLILTDCNDAAFNSVGEHISGLIGIKVSRLFKNMSYIIDDMTRCLTQKVTIEREIAHTFRATGQKKYMAVKYVFIPPDNVLVHVDDITSQKETEEYLKYISIHDTMTGLYNRFYADTEINRIKESRNYPISVIMIDLDGLKEVNDRLGHTIGDQMIKATAEILKLTFRPDDLIARIGGDEFLVILPSVDENILQDSISRLKDSIRNYNAAANFAKLSFSFGVATADSGDNLLDCMKQADMIMYQYKAKKKNKCY